WASSSIQTLAESASEISFPLSRARGLALCLGNELAERREDLFTADRLLRPFVDHGLCDFRPARLHVRRELVDLMPGKLARLFARFVGDAVPELAEPAAFRLAGVVV